MCQKKIRVLIWNEFIHEKREPNVASIYPDGIHMAIADGLKQNLDFEIRTATLDSPDQGLSEEELKRTDVLLWWGHEGHDLVTDENAQRVANHVRCGMGFIPQQTVHAADGDRMCVVMVRAGCKGENLDGIARASHRAGHRKRVCAALRGNVRRTF